MRRDATNPISTGLVAFLFFVISLALTSYTSKNKDGVAFGRSIAAESMRPFAVVTYGAYDWARGVWYRYIQLISVAEENEKLLLRLNVLESVNSRLTEIDKENNRLKSLLSAKESSAPNSIAARVIGYDPSGWVQSVTINRGSLDNVQLGSAVIDGAGVVGQVIAVSPNSAKVLLVIDRASSVDAMIQDSRSRGVLDGNGSNICDFKFVNEADEVRIGDKLITSGMDEIFPKGLVLGIVTSVNKSTGGLFKTIKISPAVNFSRLEDVLVMLGNGE